MDWTNIFQIKYPKPGASSEEIANALTALAAPLSNQELESIQQSQTNPFPASDPLYTAYTPFDPTSWSIPTSPLPPTYLDFLRWSNGGSFFNGDRCFDTFFPCSDLRHYLIGYHIPQYLPGAIPFASTGNGEIYYFDMRNNPVENEYPILLCSFGDLRYNHSVEVGKSFLEACLDRTNPVKE